MWNNNKCRVHTSIKLTIFYLQVQGKVLVSFYKAIGIVNTILVFLAMAINQFFSVSANIWLTRWSSKKHLHFIID